jgi:glucosamine--fructose-6-phosphate aminotransferase (isomerizing)
MCGIVGYLGEKEAQGILIEGLAKLEYRGYDSAGVATLQDQGDGHRTHVVRAAGKLQRLREELEKKPCPGSRGIAHTRWATHGRPNNENAHPHTSDGITVVHNGIVENHVELRNQLLEAGRQFSSETDTEIFAHLIAVARSHTASLEEAVREALQVVRGAFALAVLDERSPEKIVVAKESTPLVIGLGEGEAFVASDIPAVLAHTRRFIFLEDGDMAVLEKSGVTLTDFEGHAIERPVKTVDWSPVMAEKGGHKHFMHKEIFEQPRAITDTLRGRLGFEEGMPTLDDIHTESLANIKRVCIVACGTSWHAGLVGKYLIEELARVPVEVDLASEFRYRNPVVGEETLVIGISQSGETADTIAALKEARTRGAQLLAICNVIDSAIPRLCAESVGVIYTRAGPEIGVASTKAFVTQMVALHLLALHFAHARSTLDPALILEDMEALARLPREIEAVLHQEPAIRKMAQHYVHARDMLYLGRGSLFPIALEGALKLKEISYIHAEGYAAGEMKHGPIALIDEDMPVVVLAVKGHGYDKVVSNLEEVRARGGQIIAVCDEDDAHLTDLAESTLTLPKTHPRTVATLATVPLQLFAYHIADLRGTDVDQPRNLAKSVTVE